jgi:hypothetical protein
MKSKQLTVWHHVSFRLSLRFPAETTPVAAKDIQVEQPGRRQQPLQEIRPGYHVATAAGPRREGSLIRWQADCCKAGVTNENAAAYSSFGA